MAVTGTGTQADPFIVHSYSEFISLSGHAPVESNACYIQFFENENPNQTIDCNDYGSEFKWGSFSGATGYGGTNYTYINLNGCTIKNFLINDGATMFSATGDAGQLVISNGSLRNIFMGSATSKICGNYVEFNNVSISANVAGSTVIPFDGNGDLIIDNCAIYLQASTLSTSLFKKAAITDTDLELHINNQNTNMIFGGSTCQEYCTLTDCRIQGKIGGNAPAGINIGDYSVFGVTSGVNSQANGKVCKLINCVVDVDLTDSRGNPAGTTNYYIYRERVTGELNTNIFCNSHYPDGKGTDGYRYPSDWNYISHSLMRNGAYLNAQGFTVVEVVEG